MRKSDEMEQKSEDLAHLARLALGDQDEDLRLFVARMVRKYRTSEPELASQLDSFLKAKPMRHGSPLRYAAGEDGALPPVDDESRLALLKVHTGPPAEGAPLLAPAVAETLEQLIRERAQVERLKAAGLHPTRSAIFVGKPGVGKTFTARWLAARLNLPLYVLDLTAVMSSLLGKTGSNLRMAIDYAKKEPCVLLLDEFDAVAKRRSDDADVGELKRLVTVMLQEVDEWPPTGLLLAATNHPELIDHALWRRFDLTVEFLAPQPDQVRQAIKRFLGNDSVPFERWEELLALVFKDASYSDIERELQRFRRALALGSTSAPALIEDFAKSRAALLDRQSRIDLAIELSSRTALSQHRVSDITGVSRDTIRKYRNTPDSEGDESR